MSLVIDAHQHFWELGRFDYSWLEAPQLAKIHRSYLPADLYPNMQAAGVHKSIFVQTQHNLEENRWVLQLADAHDFIAGVVGWVDLASADCEQQVLEFKQHPKFVGVRHVVQDEPNDNFIIQPAILRGLEVLEKHNVPFDMLFFVKHLPHAATLAKRFPNLKLVLNHLSKPRIKEQVFDDWHEHFLAAASFPNVYCKLSGMVTEADWNHWTAAHLQPYVQIALQAFGAERLMFGTDWPVCELAASYTQVVQALKDALGNITHQQQAAIFGETAQRVYSL
jgi:L-fuconolactonase